MMIALLFLTASRYRTPHTLHHQLPCLHSHTHSLACAQTPVLFTGSIRSNLSPFGEHDDAELWAALERSHLAPIVRAAPGTLFCSFSSSSSSSSPEIVCTMLCVVVCWCGAVCCVCVCAVRDAKQMVCCPVCLCVNVCHGVCSNVLRYCRAAPLPQSGWTWSWVKGVPLCLLGKSSCWHLPAPCSNTAACVRPHICLHRVWLLCITFCTHTLSLYICNH